MTRILVALFSSTMMFSALAGNPQPHGSAMNHEMHVSMQKMHNDMMNMKMSGDPEADFMMMMIPHHQGAIDMSKIYLKHGSSPEIRARAQKIIDDQTKEIEEMKALIEAELGSSGHEH